MVSQFAYYYQSKFLCDFRYDDHIELGLFITRYVITILLFVLGIKAPGLPSNASLREWRNEDPEVEEEEPVIGGIKKHKKSTFSNLMLKTRTLMPYVWPKRDRRVQLCVILSFILLVAGRGVNLLTPIFYKKIGELRI